MLNFDFILLIVILVIQLAIALIVFLRDLKNRINRYFSIMIFFAIIWILSNYLENEPLFQNYGQLLLQFDFASAILLGLFFYLFCLNFPYLKDSSLIKRFAIYTPAIFLAILSFTDFVIKDINFENHTIVFNRGVGFLIYFLLMIFYIGDGCRHLIFKYKKAKGIERIQIFYIFLGLFITAVIAIFLNLILPQIIFVPTGIARIGIYAFLAFCVFAAYAIVKHHLMNIKIIITELLVGLVGIILLVDLLSSKTISLIALKAGILLAFSYLGYQLIRSVYTEIQRREEIERIDRAKSEFISIASHQLRTPLTAVKGYISMIIEGTYGKLNKKVLRPLQNVFHSNERLIKLVNDLLNLSRLDAGKIKFEPTLTSLEEMVQGIIEELKIAVENKGLYIKMGKLTVPLPKIMVDQDMFRQVALNIIDNAIKYTKKGGITIELEKLDDWEQIRISDTGEGMTKKEIESLFQMFSRATAGTQLHTEGAGIGLYVAKQFIEMHGGKIWAESAGKGKGSAFFIQLPIHLDPKLLKAKTKTITKGPIGIVSP